MGFGGIGCGCRCRRLGLRVCRCRLGLGCGFGRNGRLVVGGMLVRMGAVFTLFRIVTSLILIVQHNFVVSHLQTTPPIPTSPSSPPKPPL